MSLYLALGDSYTIGEQVPYEENFPSQTVQGVRSAGTELHLSRLTAVTGWTTDELAMALANDPPSGPYDWVTLLIGVNNQYRGRSAEEYHWQFYSLLCQAILYAGGRPERVIVLSIPDWGLTPFNTERDKAETSAAIDAFNAVNKQWAEKMGCPYVDVTPHSRQIASNPEYLAEDKLHYSAKTYGVWAAHVADIILRA
jgi:lysophospholipase L1-like esterase